MNRALSSCPVCASSLIISELACNACGTRVSGAFAGCGFCGLSAEQTHFLRTFLSHRGNLSGVGGELGISYPTVAKRLDAVLGALGLNGAESGPDADNQRQRVELERLEILEQLDRGDITAEEATRRLKDL